jgi:serine/threonine-protein kinase
MIGQTIGQFVLLEKLGEGSMGEVFKARDTLVHREVALKLLRKELGSMSNVVERFRTEARSLAQLNHPNIAGLYTFFEHGDEHVMAIEYVPGRTLERILRDHGPLDEPLATGIAFQILQALDHAHAAGVIHRDIKPANVIVTDTGTVKVTDFSIAKVVGGARLTKRGSIVGTMEYVAPERLQGLASDHRSDLYSVGAVLYEMLTGHVPFEYEREIDLIQAHIRQAPPPMASHGRAVAPAVEMVTRRALAKNPTERFASALEFQQAISVATGASKTSGQGSAPGAAGKAGEVWRRFASYTIPLPGVPSQYSTAPWVAGATVVSIVLVALVVAALLPSPPEREPGRINAPVQGVMDIPQREPEKPFDIAPPPQPDPVPPASSEDQRQRERQEQEQREKRRKALDALGIEEDPGDPRKQN